MTPDEEHAPTLKSVLMVDNRGKFAPAGVHSDLVRFERTASMVDFDPAVYATVFVHANNPEEVSWAEDRFPVHFVFTGEMGTAGEVTDYAGIFELPRWALEQYFEAFLEAYVAKGEVDEEVGKVFYGLQPTH